jgi:hypothetical protein
MGCGSVNTGGDRADAGGDGGGGPDARVADSAPPPVTVRRPLVAGGPWSAIVIGESGLPVVFFLADDPEVSDLRVLDCETPRCEDAELSSRAFEVPGSNSHFRATLDPSGRPLLAYRQDSFNSGEGKFIRCADARCRTTPPVVQKFLEASNDGEYASIALQDNGFPMLAWRDGGSGVADAMLCGDADCADFTVVSGFGPGDVAAAIALGTDNLPRLASMGRDIDSNDGKIRLSVCKDAACSSRVDRDFGPPGSSGLHLSMVVPSDGQPLLFHHHEDDKDLIASKCAGTDCATQTHVVIDGMDSADPTGFHTTAMLAPDGLAVVAFHDPGAGVLKIARCNDAACSDPVVRVVDDGLRDAEQHVVGSHPHLAFAADGNPVISYADTTDGMIYLAFCGAPDCESAE